MICQLMLMVKMKSGHLKSNLLTQNPLERAQRLKIVLQCLGGGQQNKGKGAWCLENKLKPKMVKPKKPEVGVWKTVESKSCHKHVKERPKPNNKLPVKS